MDVPKDFQIGLIELFRDNRALWDPNDERYRDMKYKNNVWTSIAERLGVDLMICRRKMESLLASHRRERSNRRKKRLTNPDVPPKTTWSYWDDFKFIRQLRSETEDGQDDEEQKLSSGDIPLKALIKRSKKYSVIPKQQEEKVVHTEISKKIEPIQSSSEKPSTIKEVSTHLLRQEDEYTAIGITVEAKLRKMSYDQRLYAENLINQTLYKGLLFQLTEQARIVTNKRRNNDYERNQAFTGPTFVSVPGEKRKAPAMDSSEEDAVYDEMIMPEEVDDALLNIKIRMSSSSDNE